MELFGATTVIDTALMVVLIYVTQTHTTAAFLSTTSLLPLVVSRWLYLSLPAICERIEPLLVAFFD
jgi:hypothetical protein